MSDVGHPAADFTLPATTGSTLRLSAQNGPVVLFFYPRDDTSGCTREAQEFSAVLDEFTKLGTQVWGISKDSVASHDKFAAKREITLPLLSDEDADTCERYDVWKEKNMYGKKFMGIERSTFLVDADGKIARIWRKVKVPGHVDAVLDAVRAL